MLPPTPPAGGMPPNTSTSIHSYTNTQLPTDTKAGGVGGSMPPPMLLLHMGGTQPSSLLETEWWEEVFGRRGVWLPAEALLAAAPSALASLPKDQPLVVVYQAGQAVGALLDEVARAGRTALLLHASDEAARDDLAPYSHIAVSHVVRNYFRPDAETAAGGAARLTLLPLGYAKGRGGGGGGGPTPTFAERPHVWSFAGSLDREGRAQAIASLQTATPYALATKSTWGAPPQQEAAEYTSTLRGSKFVPSFRGWVSGESFRLYEALEQGALPVYVEVDLRRGAGPAGPDADELAHVLGADHKLLALPDWGAQAPELLQRLATSPNTMEAYRGEVLQWWLALKAKLQVRCSALLRGEA